MGLPKRTVEYLETFFHSDFYRFFFSEEAQASLRDKFTSDKLIEPWKEVDKHFGTFPKVYTDHFYEYFIELCFTYAEADKFLTPKQKIKNLHRMRQSVVKYVENIKHEMENPHVFGDEFFKTKWYVHKTKPEGTLNLFVEEFENMVREIEPHYHQTFASHHSDRNDLNLSRYLFSFFETFKEVSSEERSILITEFVNVMCGTDNDYEHLARDYRRIKKEFAK